MVCFLSLHTHTRTSSHLFGDVVLDQAIEGHHATDFQQHRSGGRLLSAPAATSVASPRHGLLVAQVAASWTAALLLAADLHATHHVVSQQLTPLQR